MAEEQVQIPGKKVLVIIRKEVSEMKFYLKGELIRYHIKDKGEGVFDILIEEIKRGERPTVDMVRRAYKEFGIENISQLYFNLRTEPSRYFKLLTGRKVDIGYMVMVSKYGFDVCSTYEYEGEDYLSSCFGIYKDKKKISYSIYAVAIPVYEEYNNVDYNYDELLDKAIENPKNIMDELTAKYVFGISV